MTNLLRNKKANRATQTIEFYLFIVYKITFDVSYTFFIAPMWSYTGDYLNLNVVKYMVGYPIYIIIARCLTNSKNNDIYTFISKLIFAMSTMSAISLYGLKNIDTVAFIYCIIYHIAVLITIQTVGHKLSMHGANIRIDMTGNKRLITSVVLLIIAVLSVYYWYKYSGGNIISLVNIAEASQYRDNARGYQSTLSGYIVGYIAKIILPLLIYEYYSRKNYFSLGVCAIIAVLMFSIAGARSYMYYYLLVFLVAFTFTKFKNSEDKVVSVILLSFIVMTLVSFPLYKTGHDFLNFALYRANGLPSAISYYYYDFFSKNELLYLRESVLRIFTSSPYTVVSSRLIGYNYGIGGSYNNNMNNGLWGDAYANFGLFGIAIYPLLIAMAFKLVNSTKNVDLGKQYLMNLLVINALTNSSFFTWLLSGGVILVYLIFHVTVANRKDAIQGK